VGRDRSRLACVDSRDGSDDRIERNKQRGKWIFVVEIADIRS
jgi:hypothetical protein